jgi:hypothetical protein
VNSEKLLNNTKQNIKGKFNMKDLGELYWLLNIKIKRDRENKMISLSQDAYIDKILKCFNLQNVKSLSIPVDPNMKLSKDHCAKMDEEKEAMRKVLYCQAIGSLMWATVATRPDITFAVSLLSQFMENPGRTHWEVIKRVFRYLKGTKNNELILGKKQKWLSRLF